MWEAQGSEAKQRRNATATQQTYEDADGTHCRRYGQCNNLVLTSQSGD
jgi:hypothetical protein